MGNDSLPLTQIGGVMENNVILEKSLDFSVRIVHLYRYLREEKKEFVLSKQVLRSGTSIGANAVEANDAISKNDFLNKMYIALKECSETCYWLELMHRTDYLTQEQYVSLMADCRELQKLLTSITKSTRNNLRNGGSH